jgi:outer membrane protein assembly factor BamB
MVFVAGCGSGPSDLPDFMKPGIRVGEDFLVKEVFVEDKRLDTVTDIAFGELDASPGLEIGIAGKRRAIIMEPDGTPVALTNFRKRYSPKILDVDGDGVCEFLHPGGHLTLLDHKGNQLWSARERGVKSTYGDVDDDGKTEFVQYYYGWMVLLDSNGDVIWMIDPPFQLPTLHIVDIDKDGTVEIVGTSFETITILNTSGSVVREKRSGLHIQLDESSLVPYPTKDSPKYFFCTGKKSYLLVSLDGDKIIQEFKGVPWCDRRVATPVRFRSDEEPYFAIFGLLPWQGRKLAGFEKVNSALYVFDSEQKLVYHEVIGDDGWAMAAVPSGRPNEEDLLVGGTGKVWRYRIRKEDES